MVITETVRLRSLNSRRSSSGCFGLNDRSTNTAISRTPTSMDTHTLGADTVPSPGMEETPNRNRARPGDISAMPTKSKDSDGSGRSLSSTNQA
jgi:hypothetical protein